MTWRIHSYSRASGRGTVVSPHFGPWAFGPGARRQVEIDVLDQEARAVAELEGQSCFRLRWSEGCDRLAPMSEGKGGASVKLPGRTFASPVDAQAWVDGVREQIAAVELEHGISSGDYLKEAARDEKQTTLIVILAAVFWLVALGLGGLVVLGQLEGEWPTYIGTAGDSVAFFTAMLTALALIAGARTLRLQIEDIKEARRERFLQRKESEKQRAATEGLAVATASSVLLAAHEQRLEARRAAVLRLGEAVDAAGLGTTRDRDEAKAQSNSVVDEFKRSFEKRLSVDRSADQDILDSTYDELVKSYEWLGTRKARDHIHWRSALRQLWDAERLFALIDAETVLQKLREAGESSDSEGADRSSHSEGSEESSDSEPSDAS